MNIKRYIKLVAISFALISCSNAVLLTSGKTFHEKHLGKSVLESKLQGRYDFEKDIAVASSASKSEISARVNAETRMHEAVKNYAYSEFLLLLEDSKITGPGFDKNQMYKFATEIADLYTRQSKEIGKFRDGANRYVAILIEKSRIKKEVIRLFKERVNSVIERLKELKEGI